MKSSCRVAAPGNHENDFLQYGVIGGLFSEQKRVVAGLIGVSGIESVREASKIKGRR